MHSETSSPPNPEPEHESTSKLGQYLKKIRGETERLNETDLLAAIYMNTLPKTETKGPSVGQRIMEQLAEISEAQVESLIRLDRLLTQADTLLTSLGTTGALPVSAPGVAATPQTPSVETDPPGRTALQVPPPT